LRIGLIHSSINSPWMSCQTITQNLIKTYSALECATELASFYLDIDQTDFEVLTLAKNLLKFKPDKIVIIDHLPHPGKLIELLTPLYESAGEVLPELIIHIFGDFTLYSKEWLKIESSLINYKVKFICASDRQADLIKKFLNKSNGNIYKSPFPVDCTNFYYDKTLYNKIRKLNDLKDEVVFVYTGRLSIQKNIIELVKIFSTFVEMTNANAKLYIAGSFDELGIPFIGYRFGKEKYEYTCLKSISEVNEKSTQGKIVEYVGNLDENNLQHLYNISDIFISLSVHNDEDYGMSPAEALCTGLPALLTNWAGYASFKNVNEENHCSLISTNIGDGKIEFNKSELIYEMISLSEKKDLLSEKRLQLSKINQGALSINSCTQIINDILKAPAPRFPGFSAMMQHLELAFLRPDSPFGITNVQFSYTDLYNEIYNAYVPK
jgi:glycosyltransferase involved in cell wall biosynthesis